MNGRTACIINQHAKAAGLTNAQRRYMKRSISRMTPDDRRSQLRLMARATALIPPEDVKLLDVEKARNEETKRIRRLTIGDTRIIWIQHPNGEDRPAMMLLENNGFVWDYTTDEQNPHTPITPSQLIFDRYWYLASTVELPAAHADAVPKALSMRPTPVKPSRGKAI